jgi:DNA-binding NtrC family response regulator
MLTQAVSFDSFFNFWFILLVSTHKKQLLIIFGLAGCLVGFDEPKARPLWIAEGPPPPEAHGLVARSAAMRLLVDRALRVAAVDTTVLITGESGTGKERLAHLIHTASRRASGPFIPLNCGAISESLLESELFGHARGAFTGAVEERAGLFEAAGGGTLLLDEVGELPPSMQVKLLRVLQEREVRRVGECRSRPVDVRILAATNSDLGEALREGRFRRDLYYRLNVVELRMPPLRERGEDILPLARLLMRTAAERLGLRPASLPPELEERLLHHPWPGNVRELENLLERMLALEDPGCAEGFSPLIRIPDFPASVKTLAELEREHILAVLAANGGNQARTARQLGIGPATLYRKLRHYGRLSPRREVPGRKPSA